MIETLNGIFETVNYKQSTSIKLYDNDEYEDYPPHWHTTMEIIMPTENIYTVECGGQTGIGGHQKEYMEKFLNICDYIEAHCSEDLTLDAVANLCGFSKFYFSRLFRQFTNVSFYKYVNQKRIAKAAELLIEPKRPITDIALSCGFSSLSSFIRMFKIVKGCTPTEFRNLYSF